MPERERAAITAELSPPFDVYEPAEWTVPFVFCSPHSGRVYPTAFRAATRLPADALRRSEDCYVDELFNFAPALGAPLIAARFPRAYVDVNREPYELDPELFDEPLPDFANSHTMRVIGGLGTIARVVSDSEQIYDAPLPLASAFLRIDTLYRPFHEALNALLLGARDRFGYAVLVDCHSMPSASLTQPAPSRPDFVIGDRFGSSCDGRITRLLRELSRQVGYQAQANRPYAGGFITEYYGRPGDNLHAIQIEINRGLYLNERTFQKTQRFDRLENDLRLILEQLIDRTTALLDLPAAAE